jgi:5-formyltetrahydrofolate cyclo-ligase
MNNLLVNFLSLFSRRYESIISQKKQIRQEIRSLKKFQPEQQKQIEANTVFKKIELLPEFKNAKTILFYWSMKDELPTPEVIAAWCTQKELLLPSIEKRRLVLKKYFKDMPLVQKDLGFWEPDLVENYVGPIDLVIVPGVAFDRNKNRMGRGKGYYDRFFKKYKPVKIGVGFDFQLMHKIPVAQHDIKMDKIVTASETIE